VLEQFTAREAASPRACSTASKQRSGSLNSSPLTPRPSPAQRHGRERGVDSVSDQLRDRQQCDRGGRRRDRGRSAGLLRLMISPGNRKGPPRTSASTWPKWPFRCGARPTDCLASGRGPVVKLVESSRAGWGTQPAARAGGAGGLWDDGAEAWPWFPAGRREDGPTDAPGPC